MSSFSALDIGLHDQESEKNFIYPDLFWFETLYASPIFDYFNEPLKSELLSKAIRQQEPRGGKVDFDVKGALAGNWFISGSTNSRDFEKQFAKDKQAFEASRPAREERLTEIAQEEQEAAAATEPPAEEQAEEKTAGPGNIPFID